MNNIDYSNDNKFNNYEQKEVDHFNAHAHQWWDEHGPLKTLHQLNPVRLKWLKSHMDFFNKSVLDVGCGGGILSNSMAQLGANVTAIDMAENAIEIAKIHALDIKSNVNYQYISIEELARNSQYQYSFDAITCLEMLEHVPNPLSIIQSCAKLIKPQGFIFFSTLNRNLKSYLGAVLVAEYILRILPKGTHNYQKLIKPSELAAWCESCNFNLIEFQGIGYNPLFGCFYLQKPLDINYLLACQA